MNWIALNLVEQLEEIAKESQQRPVLIYKHSTRCNISRASLDRLERNYKPEELQGVNVYFLDLLSFRDVSQAVAQKFNVIHESPQAIVIRNGKAIYAASHFEIDYNIIRAQLN
jgi:bacillithiol system protein YtxJ